MECESMCLRKFWRGGEWPSQILVEMQIEIWIQGFLIQIQGILDTIFEGIRQGTRNNFD